MLYKSTRRSWIKIWTVDWLTGTTRFELDPAERSVFVDLLALAGQSRYPGVVCSGKYIDGYRGYPLKWLSGALNVDEEILQHALGKCVERDKIKIDKAVHDGTEDLIIFIVNWEKYQSEYQRQRKDEEEPEKDKPPKSTKTVSQKPPPDPHVTEISMWLEEERGYPSPNYPAEAKSIKWMLTHNYSPEQIEAAYITLKGQKFFIDKPVLASDISKNIGELVKKKVKEKDFSKVEEIAAKQKVYFESPEFKKLKADKLAKVDLKKHPQSAIPPPNNSTGGPPDG